MFSSSSEWHVLGQALIAIALGGVVGWERETAGKWAGIRTHMLVCLATMLFIRVGEFLVAREQAAFNPSMLRTDPIRILEAIATGIAFIGAGTVFMDRTVHRARGLTTAASLLAITPIGIAVAIDKYIIAVGGTAIIFVVLRFVNWIEFRSRLKPQNPTDQT